MGKCLSRNANLAKGENAVKESKDEPKDGTVKFKPKDEKTANGQVDVNHVEEENSNAAKNEDAKTVSSKEEIKSLKETKTVRITETKTSEEKVEQEKSDEPVQITKVIAFLFCSAVALIIQSSVVWSVIYVAIYVSRELLILRNYLGCRVDWTVLFSS